MMHLEILPNNFIINPPCEVMDKLQSDFALKAIRFANNTDTPIEITALKFEVFAAGKIIKEIVYTGDALTGMIAEGSNLVKGYGSRWFKSMLGSSISWNPEKTKASRMLSPNEEIAIINEFFIVINKRPVDMLGIRVLFKENAEEKDQYLSVPVINYKTKNEYIFPVKGVWQVNGNYDCLGAHRTQYSMEFAIDLGQLNQDGMFEWKENMKDEDYIDYGKEIRAIGDGEVVDCFRDASWRINFPHDTASDEEKAQRAKIEEEVGMLPIQCGNYAVIKHEHGEYSFYGHMIRQSLTVKKGDFVKKGDVIGKIGNVGYSGAPHLHFHLMDGPDFYCARGLPCHFTNLISCSRNPVSLIQEEYTIVSAE